MLSTHRRLSDRRYLEELERQITQRGWTPVAAGSPADWAMESYSPAKPALLPQQGAVDEAYYRAHISAIDHRLAQGGLRLAAVLNQALVGRRPHQD